MDMCVVMQAIMNHTPKFIRCKIDHSYSTFYMSWQEGRSPTSGKCIPGKDYYQYSSGWF